MTTADLAFSIVVATLGRCRPLLRLLDSLEAQTCRVFEVIVVDQSGERALADVLGSHQAPFPVAHIHTPGERGLSRGRNRGWRAARGRFVLFPDDDCWYPPWLVARAADRLRDTGAQFLTGRAADESGRSINGRYLPKAQAISRGNVWNAGIEWMMFFDRQVLEAVGGFDEAIGVGAATPWSSAEGQDLLLRALAMGFRGYFDPSLHGFHAELDIRHPDAALLGRARAYGRGMGYVLRRHGFGLADLAYWLARPAAGAALCGLGGRAAQARYYFNMAAGRLEGWRGAAGSLPAREAAP